MTQATNRMAVLANGGVVPLEAAAATYALLKSHLQSNDAEWDVLYYLRELCLGRPIDNHQRFTLLKSGLLESDGELHPAVRDVVLSAVRGEDQMLHLESPFTSADDRAIAELINATTYVKIHVPPNEAEKWLKDHLGQRIDKVLNEFDTTNLPDPRMTPELPTLSPEAQEQILKNILNRRNPPNDSDPSPDHPTPPPTHSR